MSKRTTELGFIDEDGFTWGEVVARHDIGDYTIVEYRPWTTSGVRVNVGNVDYGKTSFSIYIDGKSTGYHADSLDMALVVAIARKYDGLNSQAAGYFAKMIGMEAGE